MSSIILNYFATEITDGTEGGRGEFTGQGRESV